MSDRFYVYAVRVNGVTRYIGKGCGNRAAVHLTRSHNPVLAAEIAAAKAQGQGQKVRSRIFSADLSDTEAFRLERRAIAKWASKLVNVSMGAHSEMERLAMTSKANLKMLKSEDQVRAEGDRMGITVERRLEHLRNIREALERFAEAA